MYIKKITIRKNQDASTAVTSVFYIPTAGITKQQLTEQWNAIARNTDIATVVTHLTASGIAGAGAPCFYPWNYGGAVPLDQQPNYDAIHGFMPYTAVIDGVSKGFNDVVCYVDDNNDGLVIANGAYIELWVNGVRYIRTVGAPPELGLYSISGSCACTTLFESSDGYFGYITLYVNKNNSGIAWFDETQSAAIKAWLNNLPGPTPQSNDPYGPAGPSEPGGGEGEFDDESIDVPVPPLPTISAVDAGFITLFAPTAAQLKQLASYMWSSGFDLNTFKLLVANPMDCILGLSIVPKLPTTAGSKEVKVGNIPTGISLPYLSTQYVELDCGTLNVEEFSGSYLDYSPYTKISLYLPYIGIVPLDIDDTMNKAVHVVYHIDVLSGALVAYVLCGGTQLYTYIGQCSSNVPITSHDFSNTINGILGIAGSIGSLAITGGASAPTEAANMAANAINALKPNVQKSGALSGTGGLMGVQYPYLICQRPRLSHPDFQNIYTGYPANITAVLGDLSGYTEVDRIHLEGVPATQDEMTEIMQLLESGVFI